MFVLPDAAEPLTQGDILDECPVSIPELTAQVAGNQMAIEAYSHRVVLLTQACDLANSKTIRIVVALVHDAQKLVDMGLVSASLVRDRIRKHQVFGWHFLPRAPAPGAIAESLVDFHNLHTVSRAVLEKLIADGKRVCRLVTPYREHMAQHFAVTYSRIALPEQYETQP